VTAVFADLVGPTPLQESIEVESAHHVMRRVLRDHAPRPGALFAQPEGRLDRATSAEVMYKIASA
jgi:hypothetical protein